MKQSQNRQDSHYNCGTLRLEKKLECSDDVSSMDLTWDVHESNLQTVEKDFISGAPLVVSHTAKSPPNVGGFFSHLLSIYINLSSVTKKISK